MSEIAIKVENISKVYKLYDKPVDRLKESINPIKKKYHRDFYALNNISFEVKKGETIGIIGRNGSGKSTLLKIITGILNPTGGNAIVNGKISALLELGAGFNTELSGIENIYLNGVIMGYSKEDMDQRLDNILQFADIGDFVYQAVKTYSSGMFVRLAFAVAINVDPEILIVDEALSVGDIYFQSKCYKKFEEFKNSGKTILFVSHDLSSISKYCDRAILINSGELILESNPKDVIDAYKKILVNQYDNTSDNTIGDLQHCDDIIWKKALNLNADFLEYGDNSAEIIDFAIIDKKNNITNSVLKGECFSIKFRVRFNQIIENPILAFTIKDVKGIEITGTNTMLEHIDITISEIGEVKEITFYQEMNLQGGEYLLSLGCTGFKNNEFVVFHRLYDICNITVISSKNSVGYYDMNSQITLT